MDLLGRVKLLHSSYVHPGMVYVIDTRHALGEMGIAADVAPLSVLINSDWLEAERSKPTYPGDADMAARILWAVRQGHDVARLHGSADNPR